MKDFKFRTHPVDFFGLDKLEFHAGSKKLKGGAGEVVRKRYLPLKFVLDERICDGFTYSCAFRTIKKCFDNPELYKNLIMRIQFKCFLHIILESFL